MEVDKSAKVLLLGRTGAGKSSFINYFLGKEVAKTGAGRPVTENYCIEYEYNDGAYPIKLYDNRGFEAKTAFEQKEVIINFVKKHNNSGDVFNWFHTIFYCVSMADARFLPFEAEFIQDLRKSISQHIHIIITKCDCASSEQIEQMRTKIKNMISSDTIEIYEVVSVAQKKHDGRVITPYGKEELSSSVFRLLWNDISSRIAEIYAREMYHNLENVIHIQFKEIRAAIDAMLTLSNFISEIKGKNRIAEIWDSKSKDIDKNIDNVIQKINNKFNNILQPIADLYISYTNMVVNSFVESANLELCDWLYGFELDDELNAEFEKYFPNLTCFDNSSNTWQIIKAGGEIVTMKSRFKKLVNSMEESVVSKIPTERQIYSGTKEKLLKFLDNFCI